MRLARPLTLLLALAGVFSSMEASADFSAGGRGKKHPPTPQQGGTKKPPVNGGTKKPPVGDTDTPKGPSREALITRYTGIVLAQPASPFPLQRLSQLYRERDGNLTKLVTDFEARAADTNAKDTWAAKVALAGILKIEGKLDDAAKAYETAIAEKPGDAQVKLALAQLDVERNDKPAARKNYDEALKLLTAQVDKETTLRALRGLTLDEKQFDDAKKYHDELTKLSGGSLSVRAELGRELLARNENERAEAEFKDVVKSATGDNRALAPALLDLGRAQAAEKKNKEALETLKHAMAVAGAEAGVRSEILAVITDVFRKDQNLAELIGMLEKEGVRDFQRLTLLGSLYEETGDVAKAVETYRKALGVNSKNIETRVKVVRLLQAEGELDAAIAENEKLIQAAPRNPDFVFQLCETLLQRGDRVRALGLLAKLEVNADRDEDVLTRVADFYERIDEKEKATKIFAHLTSIAPNDPAHLVELGDRFWDAGDQKKAMETWQRIRTAVPNKGKALTALGDVLLDHGKAAEALEVLKEATESEPSSLVYKKAYAIALERSAVIDGSPGLRNSRFDEARASWEDILEKSHNDRLLSREARTHVVMLWGLLKQLEPRAEPLKRRLADDPPDLDAGRLLAEVQIHLRKLEDAEKTLAKVTSLAPGDEDAFLALERVRVLNHDLKGAIAALEKLAELDPKRAREFYQRMAQYSVELFKDDDAITYAEKAVALSPDDAEGHKKLGEMYRRRGDANKAIQSFRTAIQKNDRLFLVYLELSELLVAKGEVDEADRLYRRVMRMAPDEELVAQAGRLSMQRNLVKGTLSEVENELLPLTIGHPQKPVYRRLLVEVYGQMTFPLTQRAKYGTKDEAEAARKELSKIGARGVKPLLDALSDTQKSQVATAIDVLAYVGNKGAGPALFSFATGSADQPLRVRAMMATGALRDPALLPRYAELVAPDALDAVAPGDPVTVAAAWSVARMGTGDRKTAPLLVRMLSSGAPEVRAFGALGLGLAKDKSSAAKLDALAKAPDGSGLSRAAAAVGLGEMGDRAAGPTLLLLSHDPDPLVRSAAMSALLRVGDPGAKEAAMGALFSADERERTTAAAVISELADRSTAPRAELLPISATSIDAESSLTGFFVASGSVSSRTKALAMFTSELSHAATSATSASAEQASRVADALLARGDDRPAFAPFTDGLETATATDSGAAEKSAQTIRAATIGAFAAMIKNPSAAVKTRAIRVLAGQPDDRAAAALAEALDDADESVLHAALAAVVKTPSVAALARVTHMLATSDSWALRVAAASALGPLAKRGGGAEANAANLALTKSARDDSFSAVRAAALTSLSIAGAANASQVLTEASQKDVEPDVRARATELLTGKP